jgi:transcriptional regulator with XRE-family HTH domain
LTFGGRLKQARTGKRLTQSQVADMLGIDFTTVSKYENDRSQPDYDTLLRLAGLYGVSVDWLLTGQQPGDLPGNRIIINGESEELTDEEALHLRDSLEMYRLLKAKRMREASGSPKPDRKKTGGTGKQA